MCCLWRFSASECVVGAPDLLTEKALAAILLIVDAATGGRFKTAAESGNSAAPYGNPNTAGVIAIYALSGVAYGTLQTSGFR